MTAPQPLLDSDSFYPRAIRLVDGTILASVVAPQPSGALGGTILESTDDGLSFHSVGGIDTPLAKVGLCCATLFELPAALGSLPAGALLWSASVHGEVDGQPMSIPVWSSVDRGRTWAMLSTVATAATADGLWEPEFSMLADGSLVCHYSDETDRPAHSQKLYAKRTTDGVAWDLGHDTVALGAPGARPGMANVRRGPGGVYFMSYEICGVDADNCTAHIRTSADGLDWGDPNDPGLRPTTIEGQHFRHAPTLAFDSTFGANGRLYLAGQMVYDASGLVAADNGTVLFANSEGAVESWYTVAAPVGVPEAYDNFCPNYSSTILPLDDGLVALEIASRYDGSSCRSFFARGPLRGSGDATGISDGATYRLVNVESALCLDVAGGSTDAGGNVQQWSCNNLPPQNWLFTRAPDGSYTLTAQNSGMCLSVAGGSADPGANVEQEPCDGEPAQLWTPRNVGLGYYVMVHTQTGACLDVAGGSTAPGGNVQQWTCNDLAPQNWHLEPH